MFSRWFRLAQVARVGSTIFLLPAGLPVRPAALFLRQSFPPEFFLSPLAQPPLFEYRPRVPR